MLLSKIVNFCIFFVIPNLPKILRGSKLEFYRERPNSSVLHYGDIFSNLKRAVLKLEADPTAQLMEEFPIFQLSRLLLSFWYD